jgi:hypothetical protein
VITEEGLRELSRGWLDVLPRSLPSLHDTERKSEVFVDPPHFDAVNDVFQTSTPWLLLATADAFGMADDETRRALAAWLSETLPHLPLDDAALARVEAWQASEAVIGLRYLLGESSL